MATKRLAILTGGLAVPGLNFLTKAVVYRASEVGYEVIGIRRGWEGLTHVDLHDPASRSRYILPLNRENTRTIDRVGGTYLHTSQIDPAMMTKVPPNAAGSDFPRVEATVMGLKTSGYDLTSQVVQNIEALGLDYLIVVGGFDTMSFAARLHKKGVNIVFIPKSVDNDVRNTEYCIGFSTAVSRAAEAIERQRTIIGSHECMGVFRVSGRHAGHAALYAAHLTATRCCLPEYEVDIRRLVELLVNDKSNNPSNYSLVVLSEGASWKGYHGSGRGEAARTDSSNPGSISEDLSTQIQQLSGEECFFSDLADDMRGGSPDFVDNLVASSFGGMAVDCIKWW